MNTSRAQRLLQAAGLEPMRTFAGINLFSWYGAAASLVVAGLTLTNVSADEVCGLCAKEIVTNSELAGCFLDQYSQIAKTSSEAVVVDLSSCASRGVVEPLPSPNKAAAEPDLQFMISYPQLDCLKRKLEARG
ncbi:hypothetical protein NKH86_30275 [Mesorhizobium sp. M0913]|uniref:hypothetical protein n=1 Tax=Mesorhizobium sp. M0913 TaxID=2957026 RepID=UPI00333B8001